MLRISRHTQTSGQGPHDWVTPFPSGHSSSLLTWLPRFWWSCSVSRCRLRPGARVVQDATQHSRRYSRSWARIYQPRHLSVDRQLVGRLFKAAWAAHHLTSGQVLDTGCSVSKAAISMSTQSFQFNGTFILKFIDRRNLAMMSLLDLSAAFDITNHDFLFQRLQIIFGFTEVALTWFRSDHLLCLSQFGLLRDQNRRPILQNGWLTAPLTVLSL
jgi:hypothetical protein